MKSLFDISTFRQKLSTQWLGQKMIYFEELESTNSYLKKISPTEVDHGMICLADHQTKGRGQYNKSWESEKGKNLTFSLAFKPQTINGLHVLTLACGCAIVEHLQNLTANKSCAYIKWPNDIMLNDKKTAGLLTETVFSGNKLDRLIIGIGLNINQKKFSADIHQNTTSIYLQTQEKVNREDFLMTLLSRIEYKYTLWHRQQQQLLKTINRNIHGYGKWINLKLNDTLLDESYKLLGVNEKGKLLVLNHDGGIESFSYEQIRLVTG